MRFRESGTGAPDLIFGESCAAGNIRFPTDTFNNVINQYLLINVPLFAFGYRVKSAAAEGIAAQ